MKERIQENGIDYVLGEDGLYYPELKIAEGTEYSIGKYGHLRKEYLNNYRKSLYTDLLLSGMLNQHLHETEIACMERIEVMVEWMKTEQGVTEKLKSKNQMLWVGKMNGIMNTAEESVLKELVYQ